MAGKDKPKKAKNVQTNGVKEAIKAYDLIVERRGRLQRMKEARKASVGCYMVCEADLKEVSRTGKCGRNKISMTKGVEKDMSSIG